MDDGGCFLNVYRLMLNEEGWKINIAECLVGVRGFRIFEKTRRYFHSLQKNIQASLILFHSFIRIIETASLRYSRSEKKQIKFAFSLARRKQRG